MPIVVGIDSSTQSTKAEVRDADTGELLASGRAPHPGTAPPRSEQEPSAWWTALEQALARAGDPRADAISIAGQQHAMVALDDAGRPLHPAKLWNDTESAPDADWLLSQLEGGAAAWATACGSVPRAAFTITKLCWLRRSHPAMFDRLASVLLPHDWLTWRMTGERVTDRGDASGTGYWSARSGAYRFDLLDVVDSGRDWAATVPQVLGPLDVVPHPGRSAAVVACGTGDNMAAALGVALAPGDVCISIGTSGTVFSVADQPTADATGAVAGFADATGRFLPLVCTLNATKVTDTVARLLDVGHGELDALARAAEPGAGGLTMVPYLDGERTPNRPGATGMITGLRTSATRGQFARAAMEGVVCGLLDGVDALGAAGVPTAGGRLVLVGGGARSSAYRQVVADLTSRQVVAPDADELVAVGACVQAAAALHRRRHAEVAAAWALGSGTTTDPATGVDATEIRQRYAVARG